MNARRLAASIVLGLVASLLGACTTSRVDERIAYWRAETAAHLPAGATRQQAEAFFAARGTTLKCCTSQPPGPQMHFASERNVGRLLWAEYDVAVLVAFSPEQTVTSVKVERWGVGL